MKHRIQNPEFRIRKIKDAGGATPTAGDRDGRDPRKVRKGGKWGVGRRLETCFREKWLCSITRIYTDLHAFTQSFWRVTLWAETRAKSLLRRRANPESFRGRPELGTNMGMGRNHRDTVAQSQDIGASADAQGKIWDGVESVPTAR